MSFSSFVCRSSRSFFLCVRDSEVFVSNFEFEFLVSLLYSISRISIFVSNFEFVFFVSLLYSISRISIFDSSFEFKFLEFSCRISNSSFSFRCSIRLLEFRCSIRLLEFRCSIRLLEFRCSIRFLEFRVLDSSALNFEFVFSRRICRRNFRCLALFDFSNFDL